MSPAEIIILVTRVLAMCGLAGAPADDCPYEHCSCRMEQREYEVQIIQPTGSDQMYDVMVPRGASQSSMGDSTVVLAGNQDY